MKNPLRTKISASNYSESSDEDDSSDCNSNDVINEKDHSEGVDEDSGSESVQVNEEDNESEEESESESEDSSVDKDEDFDHKWEEMRNEAPDTDEITRRIAVVNMDWDRIRATDLLVCFNSFKPADGIVNSVKIYPSEFGLKRMEEERLTGPPELVEEKLPIDDEEEEVEDKKESKYHREKLRQYQINRLKYYYAVIDCDTPETANAIYEQLNGMEYESSSVRFDLRFIPDDMTFDREPTSVSEQVPTDYKPRLFVTSALQQVKVDLTWDETDPKRKEFFQKIFTDIDSVQDDIKNYLASASSESEEEVSMVDDDSDKTLKRSDRIAKYKELFKSMEEAEKKEKEEKIYIEFTWDPDLEFKAKEKVTEKIKKDSLNPKKDSLNPFEELLLKKKEQKKMKKKELQKHKIDEESDENTDDESLALKVKTKEKVKEKIKKDSLNPFEELPLKKKEQKKMKKKELQKHKIDEESDENTDDESLGTSSNENSEKHKKLAELALISDYKNKTESVDTSSSKKKKKNKIKSDDLDGFVADMNDPRFSAMHTSSLFNMVPSEQHGKKSDRNFNCKRSKERKFKHGQKNKKAKYH